MADIDSISGRRRAELLRQAHHLEPVAAVGKLGRTPELMQHIDTELTQHELIKIRFTDFKDQRQGIAEEIALNLEAALVKIVGHIAILYRPTPDSEDRV
jgi:RNA-binding protein